MTAALLLLSLCITMLYIGFAAASDITARAIARGAAERLTPDEAAELDRLFTKALGE